MSPRPARRRPALRRSLTGVLASLAVAVGFIAVAPSASAAGPWFVAATRVNNAANCIIARNCVRQLGRVSSPSRPFANGDTSTSRPAPTSE